MTPERLEQAKAYVKEIRSQYQDSTWAAEIIRELVAEVERLTLENLELDLQVLWDRGAPKDIDEAQAALDAEKAYQAKERA